MLYLCDVGSGNLGRSMTTGQLVTKDLRERLPASLELTLTALLIALVMAVPLGVLAALRPGSAIDHGVRFFCTLGVCVPTFVSGLLLIYVFYYLLGLAPDPTGRIDIFASLPPRRTGFLLIDFLLAGDLDGWWAAFRQLMLPALTMALFVVAPLARMTRASMLAVAGQRLRPHRAFRGPVAVAHRRHLCAAQRASCRSSPSPASCSRPCSAPMCWWRRSSPGRASRPTRSMRCSLRTMRRCRALCC